MSQAGSPLPDPVEGNAGAVSGARDGRVVVVGAGAAGLAAAAALRAAGQPVTLIEAAPRIGGRAWTAYPAALGGAAFDHGASWLHAAHRNPLVAMAQAAGAVLLDSDATRSERLMVDARSATPAEHAAYDAAEAAWTGAVTACLPGPDRSLADAAASVAHDPWTANLETWEATIIAAADPDLLSLRDWHANRLEGPNLRAPGGLGALLLRCLAPLAGEVALGTPATRIAWDGSVVRVHTPRGTIEAASCIVTVSTGVLRAGAIAFDPPLPAAVQAALDGLPMGLLSKVALRAAGPDRLGLPPGCSVERRLGTRGQPALMLQAWPDGQDHAIGFLGGRIAWELATLPPAESLAFARAQVARALGSGAVAAFREDGVVTRWGTDPLSLGAYAYALPGAAGARAVLGTPLAAGRLVFAGEAVRTDGLAGTVGGAMLSGQAAAAMAAGP